MTSYFAADALLAIGWARDVRIDVDEHGNFGAVVAGADDAGAERLAGPALPGMANLHSHAFQRAMAGLTDVRGAPEDDFWSWRELMYRFALGLTPDQALAIARHLYIEMLCHGYTAVGEFHYLHNDAQGAPYAPPQTLLAAHLAAAREAGIAATLLPSLYAWGNFGGAPLALRQRRFAADPRGVLDIVAAMRREIGADPDFTVGAAPHSLRAVDPAALRELVEGMRAIDPVAPIHIHAAEQTKEVDDCLAVLGERPVAWLLANLPVDSRWCIVHATHMTDGEIAALARSGAVAGLCPSTEANLGDGLFPLLAYRAAGGHYGVGGDSHVSRNPAEELRLLEYLQRISVRRRNLVVGETSSAVGTTLWLEAAAGGGRALARDMGRIAAGSRADLVVLDDTHADLAARTGDGIANAMVFACGENPVRDVMVGGSWVVQGGRHRLQETAAVRYRRALRELLA